MASPGRRPPPRREPVERASARTGRGGPVRRANSMQRTAGRIDEGGEPEVSALCARALMAAVTDDEAADSLTHPVHTYPARMHPGTARILVSALAGDCPRDAAVVDPFCGAGTTLVEARSMGVRAVGIDLNPLAVLLARAKTWSVPQRRRFALRDLGQALAAESLDAGKLARRKAHEIAPERRPAGFDPKARDQRLARWYAPHVRRELETLMSRIEEVRDSKLPGDDELADQLTAALSAILYKVSSRTSDTDPTWVERNIARGNPTRLFAQRVELLVEGLGELATTQGQPPRVIEGDARQLGTLIAERSAWAVITSPPYPGTYDYAEHQRLRFDFLGLRHRAMDDGEIGSRRGFASNPQLAHAKWRYDLAEVLRGIAVILAPGRPAALVIGDSLAAGAAVDTLEEVRIASEGVLKIIGFASQTRPKLGQAEMRAFGHRDKFEHIIILEAVGGPLPPRRFEAPVEPERPTSVPSAKPRAAEPRRAPAPPPPPAKRPRRDRDDDGRPPVPKPPRSERRPRHVPRTGGGGATPAPVPAPTVARTPTPAPTPTRPPSSTGKRPAAPPPRPLDRPARAPTRAPSRPAGKGKDPAKGVRRPSRGPK